MFTVSISTEIIERDIDTNLYIGYVPRFTGAHSQGETLGELNENFREVNNITIKYQFRL